MFGIFGKAEKGNIEQFTLPPDRMPPFHPVEELRDLWKVFKDAVAQETKRAKAERAAKTAGKQLTF